MACVVAVGLVNLHIQGPILKLRVKGRSNAECARPTLVFGPMKQPEPHGAPGVLAKTKRGSTQSAYDPRNSLSSQPA